jgi:hypothetical protein
MHPHERAPRVSTLWPPVEVRSVCDTYLSMVDEELPGLVEGLYLHGSIGFGEWHAGRSDVDFVAVTRERPTAREVARLDAVHERLGSTFPHPTYDGFYVTWADLARSSDDCPDVPCILAGDFREAFRYDVSPVTWHELAWHGLTLRGPDLADVDVWTDLPALRRFTHDNLSSYWEPHVRELATFPDEAARADLVAWFALGIPRLHHLLATNRLTSKSGAGEHALEVFGEQWRILLAEALSYRATGERIGMLDDAELARQNIAFSEQAVEAALAVQP